MRFPTQPFAWPVSDTLGMRPVTWTTTGTLTVQDRTGRDVILFESPWELRYVVEHNPHVQFRDSM